ncbi:MAG: 1,4-alpha-glucan branching protein GlgB [Blautia sp.]|nr:1,4-alpha-glucan branching protein GlgB [Blautia sp.]MDY5030951.1 1,4-alpha-glucan branching protein GlgB [Blautia sp.]
MKFSPIPKEFHMGDCVDAYHFLGAHPVSEDGVSGWSFRIWAPNAKAVEVCGDFNEWKGTPMVGTDCGVWNLYLQEPREGQLYKYNIQDQNGHWMMHSDPYAFAAELRPGTASRLVDLSFIFEDEAWMKARTKCHRKPVNIYELHAGSWKHKPGMEEEDGPDSWYSYEELADLLIPWLLEHHYTHVELLPLSEHPFDGSWGYQTTGYFAVTGRYGSPAQFAAFVNACHKAGIGVLMDFVPVHFAANADGLERLDGTPLYEYDSDVGYSEWGTHNFNFYRGEVCSFLLSAAAMWMDVYHCDGIRMDAISRAIYWMGDPNRGVNEGAVRFLQKMNHHLNAHWPTGIYIAEDSTNYLKVTAPTRYGGLGFDYKWDLGWMHDTLDYFATPFWERKDRYHMLTFSMAYFYNELYMLCFSHDEVVHGKKTIIDKLWGTYEEKCSQLRTLYFYMYTHPGKKLNFMGNETAHFREWDEKKELNWNLLTFPFHDAFQKYIARLGELYSSQEALYKEEYDSSCFEWVACESLSQGVYAWLRRNYEGSTVLCIMNTQNQTWEDFPMYLRSPSRAVLLLDSEAPCWGGENHAKQILETTEGGVYGKDYTLSVTIPSMGSLLYQLSPEK